MIAFSAMAGREWISKHPERKDAVRRLFREVGALGEALFPHEIEQRPLPGSEIADLMARDGLEAVLAMIRAELPPHAFPITRREPAHSEGETGKPVAAESEATPELEQPAEVQTEAEGEAELEPLAIRAQRVRAAQDKTGLGKVRFAEAIGHQRPIPRQDRRREAGQAPAWSRSGFCRTSRASAAEP